MSRHSADLAVVVDDGSDELARKVETALRRRAIPVCAVSARELALVRLDLDAHHAAVDGRRVGALLFRARPHADFGGGFDERDASFSSSEAKSAWLAVMALPSVAVVNRLDAETWFSFSEWPTWRRRMVSAGVAVAELAAGGTELDRPGTWLPWGGGVATVPQPAARQAFGAAVVEATDLWRSLWCYGSVVAGPSSPSVRAAGRVLAACGVNLAEIVTQEDGAFVSGTAHPQVPADATAVAAGRITGALGAHLRRR